MQIIISTLPPVFGTADLRRQEISPDALRHGVTKRRWLRVSRGLYADADTWATAAMRERLIWTGVAQQRNYHPDKIVSHVSAAAGHGLDLPLGCPGTTWLTTQDPRVGTRRTPSVIVERATLAPPDVVVRAAESPRWPGSEWSGTSPARTVADCARHLSLPEALAIADSAARIHPRIAAALDAVLRRQAGWPGAQGASRVARLLDGRRETWLESYSAGVLHLAGLPVGEPQVRLFDDGGRFVARVDALWHEWGVVGEADGFTKYLRAGEATAAASGDTGFGAVSGAEAVRIVVEEKRREDRIRDLGLEVVRWSVSDVTGDPGALLTRLSAARRRGNPGRFTGLWAPTDCRGMSPDRARSALHNKMG